MAVDISMFKSLVRETFESKGREGAERMLREGIAAGEDTSGLIKKLSVWMLDENGEFMTMVRAIPGSSEVPHLATIAVAHILEDSNLIDSLIPDNKTPAVRGLKFALKTGLAGMIAGIGEGTSGFLRGKVAGVVDDHVSAERVAVADRKGRLDELLIISDERFGLRRPLIMARDASGDVLATDRGYPRVEDGEGMAFISAWERANPEVTTTKKSGGKGGQTTSETKKLTPPWRRVWLSEYLALLKSSPGTTVDQALIERLEKLVTPSKSSDWEEGYSMETLRVQRATAASAPDMPSIMRAEIEEMWRSVRKRKPPMKLLNFHVGETFHEKITAEGKLSVDDIQSMIDTMDMHLRGDQGLFTQGRKALGVASDYLRTLGTSEDERKMIRAGLLGILSPGLLWAMGAVLTVMLLVTAIAMSGSPFMSTSWAIGMICSMVGGVIGFNITWPVPFVEMVLTPLFGGKTEDDWLKDIGRQVAAFALALGCGILPLLIYFEAPAFVAALFVSGLVLAPIGYLFTYARLGEHEQAKQLVLRNLKKATWVLMGATLVVTVAVILINGLLSHWVSGPELIQLAVLLLTGVVSGFVLGLLKSWIFQLIVLALVIGFAAWRFTKAERVWDGGGYKIHEIPVWRPVLIGLAIVSLIGIGYQPVKAEWKQTIASRSMESFLAFVQSWDDPDPAPATTPASTAGGQSTSTPSGVGKPPTQAECNAMPPMFRKDFGCK